MAAIALFKCSPKVSPVRLLAFTCLARRGRNAVLACPNLPSIVNQRRHAATSPSTNTGVSTGAAHDHSKMWTAERVLSAALIGLVPAAIAFPSDVLNYALAFSLTMHAHWGLEAIVVDYVRPSIFGSVLSRVSLIALYVLSVVVLGSLCYFNYSDVGIAQAIRMFWAM